MPHPSYPPFDRLVEHIRDGIFVIRRSVFEYVNQSGAAMVGYAPEDLVGQPFSKVVAPESRALVSSQYQDRLAGKDVPSEYCFHLLHRDGRQRLTVSMSVGLMMGDDGVFRFIGSVKDITESRAFMQHLSLLREMVEQSRDPFFVAEQESGQLVEANQAASSTYGYSLQEFLSLTLFDLEANHSPWPDWQKQWEYIAQSRSGLEFETHHRTKDRQTIPVNISAKSVVLGDTGYVVATVRDIGYQQQLNGQLSQVIQGAALGYWDWNVQTGAYQVNDLWLEMLGRTGEKTAAQGLATYTVKWPEGIHPEDQKRIITTMETHMEKGEPFVVEFRMHHKNGSWVWIQCSGTVVERDEQGQVRRLSGTHQNITAHKEREKEIRNERQFLQDIINGVDEPLMVLTPDHQILLMNTAAQNNAPEGLLAQNRPICCYEVAHHRTEPCNSVEHPCPLQEVAERKEVKRIIHRHLSFKGDEHRVEITFTPLWDYDGVFIGVIESSRDITKEHEAMELLRAQEKHLQHLAYHDPLTGLPNRLLLMDRVQQALHAARRYSKVFAVLFIDLDNFKVTNDLHGHTAGDWLLTTIAERLREQVRAEDTVARVGGDEFVVLLQSLSCPEDGAHVSAKIMTSVQQPAIFAGTDLNPSISVGVSLFPKDGVDEDSLMHHADAAMYKAKKSGGGKFILYCPDTCT